MTIILDTIIQGSLLGGLFALYALGLSLIFGVMRIVNIAHGDFIVVIAYVGLVLMQTLGLHPLISIPLVIVMAAALGWILQAVLFDFVPNIDPLPSMLVAFGLQIIIQNTLLLGFGADPKKLSAGPIEVMSIELLPDIFVGVLPLIIFATAIILILILQAIIYRTGFGRQIRAVSDNEENARMIGIDTPKIFRKAFALVLVTIAISGLLMAVKGNFTPASGPTLLLFAFEAVIIGGMGSLWGTLVGGIVIGIAHVAGAQIDAGFQTLAGHAVFLLILVFYPSGLFAKQED
ncbi:MAG: branched-chain amino acid ABC transporter permease [Rhodobacteraceae bacterium]|nr:MAG: branched-chain amino acid ABC transporter permease [Paracoccaceae bacterium]